MKQNIAIVYGGYQSEAEVSARSKDGLMTMIDFQTYKITLLTKPFLSFFQAEELKMNKP